MTAQAVPNLLYVLLLAVVLAIPFAAMAFKPVRPGERIAFAILAGAVALTGARLGGFSLLGVALLVPLAGLGLRFLAGGIAALLLVSPAPWWSDGLPLAPVPAALFILLALGAALLPRLGAQPANAREPILTPVLLSGIVGLATGLLTAPFDSIGPGYTAWHHWGAYLSPVEAWLSGGLPYRDFPVQYGLGPTTLLAATCGTDCWRALYWTAILANAVYFATLAGCAILLTVRASRGLRWLGLIALFCATFLWTGFPMDLAGPAMTPSVAGLRFLTISALLLHILHAEQSERPRARDWIGHLLWGLDLFWSPEAAFFGTLIWWPYLALRDAGRAATARDALVALGRGALRGMAALIAGLALLTLTVWLLSGGAASLADFLAYIQHPPGPLPVNPLGIVWLAIAIIGLAAATLAGSAGSRQARSLYACLLGFMAAGPYYLSRSHDNNILNLFPLLVLLLLALLAVPGRTDLARPDFARGFAQTVLAAMIAFVATFHFGSWAEAIAAHGAFAVGPDRLVARFTPGQDRQPALLTPEAMKALAWLRARGVPSPVMLDNRKVMIRSAPGTGWTGVNNLANFMPLPDATVLHYIRQGATTYRRSGWLLVEEARFSHWADLFKTAYAVREAQRIGPYTAYHLVPRPDR